MSYGCLDLRFEENVNVDTYLLISVRPVQFCDVKENENVNTFEKSERSEFIGGFHPRRIYKAFDTFIGTQSM